MIIEILNGNTEVVIKEFAHNGCMQTLGGCEVSILYLKSNESRGVVNVDNAIDCGRDLGTKFYGGYG